LSSGEARPQKRFDQAELQELVEASKRQESWAEERRYAITGDSAPPPIPLGIEEADPAGTSEAIEQALDLQRDDPPPPGATWHVSRADESVLRQLIGDDAHKIVDLLSQPVDRNREAGRVVSTLPIAAALAATLLVVLTYLLWP
jgi:hypothetical protein